MKTQSPRSSCSGNNSAPFIVRYNKWAPFSRFVKEHARYPPYAVMADAAAATTKSLRSVFPETKRLTCHWHVGRKWRENLQAVRAASLQLYKELYEDLVTLQLKPIDESSFAVVEALFELKWKHYEYTDDRSKTEVMKFLNYFRATWLGHGVSLWFQSANPQVSLSIWHLF